MLRLLEIFSLFILLIFLTFHNCNSTCDTVSSSKYGKLIPGRQEKANYKCRGNLIFKSQQTGKKFCLKKNVKEAEQEEISCDGCTCGRENKPQDNSPAFEIVGGEFTGENQYPWYALIFLMWATMDRESKHKGGYHLCGGTLISDKVIISAAHCARPLLIPSASSYFIGLGLHNISGFDDWSSEEFGKHNIMEVEDIILHDKWGFKGVTYDFSLFILKKPVKFSKKVNPLCLPNKQEIDILEKKENIVVGYGKSKIWFIEYKRLLGGDMEPVPLINPELFRNHSALIAAFTEGDYEKNMIDGYFKTFIDLFPGMERCMDNHDFVCNMDSDLIDEIIRNMEQKIRNSGTKNENKDVEAFLEATRSNILPRYAKPINNWANIVKQPFREKLEGGLLKYFELFGLRRKQLEKISSSIKFVNQFWFIEKTRKIAGYGIENPDILKMARGKFMPWSEAEKWTKVDPTIIFDKSPSTILTERFEMEDGYGCVGDSGGPVVVKSDGRFVLVAVLSGSPLFQSIFSWPPPCSCSCKIIPETNARVSSVLPWIYKNMKDRKLKITCQR